MYVCAPFYHELSTLLCTKAHQHLYSCPPEDYMPTHSHLIHTLFRSSRKLHANSFTPLFMPIWACSLCLFLFYIYLLSYPFTQSVSQLHCCKLLFFSTYLNP